MGPEVGVLFIVIFLDMVQGVLITVDVLKESFEEWGADVILLTALCKERMRKICGFRDGMHLSRLVIIYVVITNPIVIVNPIVILIPIILISIVILIPIAIVISTVILIPIVNLTVFLLIFLFL
jgi:hypothetical protein